METMYEKAYREIKDIGEVESAVIADPLKPEETKEIVNCLTIDVEDWFQGLELDSDLNLERRIEKNLERVLILLDECKTKATFFVLGKIANDFPWLIREIVRRGHELGSHGNIHKAIYSMTPDNFHRDLCESIEAIERSGGAKVSSFRAPFFSITEDSLWALSIIAKEGIKYDSSIFPIRYYRYGIETSPLYPFYFHVQNGLRIVEFPISTFKFYKSTCHSRVGVIFAFFLIGLLRGG
jgi:polysaccharide deacetylase family protein (PEP-CTERM system associated)